MVISNEQKIYDKLTELFPQHIKEITMLSRNYSDNRDFIQSNHSAFDFDKIENTHISGSSSLHSSPDCLIIHNNILYFIEFKEGDAKTANVRNKIHEAIATLYNFCKCQLPQISKEDFAVLKIKYAVFMRKGNPSSFLSTLQTTKERFHLKNLEGHIVNHTKVTNCPNVIHSILDSITNNKLGRTTIYNREYPPTVFN